LTDNSLDIGVGSFVDSSASAFASITHDDFYAVPVNGPVSALVRLTCSNASGFIGATTGHFSLGSTNVSPTAESVFYVASQGSGTCGLQYQKPKPIPPVLVVSLLATNNLVELHTYIDGGGVG
jgi:hypothetical protein